MTQAQPFTIRRSELEVAGDKLYRFELVDTRSGTVVCISRNESATAPRWISRRCATMNRDADRYHYGRAKA